MNALNLRACISLGILAFGLNTSASAANIVADFSDGNSSTLVDGWFGTAGEGWTQAWRDARNNTSYTASVQNTNSLQPGGGNYLSATFTAQAGNVANKQGYVARMFNPGYVTTEEKLVISFLFRPDSAQSGSQYYNMMFNGNGVVNGTGPSNLLVINSAGNGTWVFGGKEAPGNTAQNMSLDSGIQVIAGNVYSFEITLDATTKSYMASVSNLTSSASYTTSEAIFFRNDATINEIALEFGAFFGTGNNATGTLSFSLDKIAVTQIPESGTVAAVFAAVGCGLVYLRRRAQR